MSKRDDIIQATIDIIADKGVMYATIANILKQASTGYGTLYNYFDSKESLYLSVYMKIITDIDNFLKNVETSQDQMEQLKHILRRYLEYNILHSKNMLVIQKLRHIPDLCQKTKSDENIELRFLTFVKACEDSDIIKKRKPFYNTNLIMVMIGAFVQYHSSNLELITKKDKEDIINSCIKAII